MNDMASFRTGRLMQLLLVVLHVEFVVFVVSMSHTKIFNILIEVQYGPIRMSEGVIIKFIISRKPIACSKE